MDAGDRLAGLGASELAPVVRRALRDVEAWPESWSWSAPSWNAFGPSTRGLFRVQGTARVSSGEVSPWVVVLKIVGAIDLPGFLEPDGIFYWRREAMALGWSELSDGGGPFVPVRLLGVEDVTTDEQWLWLESLDDSAVKPRWSPEQHVAAAYDLGAFSARWSASPPRMRDFPWLSQRWLRGWLSYMEIWGSRLGVDTPTFWVHPLLAGALPSTTHSRVVQLMADAEPILAVLESLPVTLAHHDAQWRNLFRVDGAAGNDSGGRTVAVDWSCVGLAPVGADLGHLIGCDIEHWAVHPSRARQHDEESTTAYLRGLEDFGWHGDERAVRLARAATAALQIIPVFTAEVCWLHSEPAVIGVDDFTSWPQHLATREGLPLDQAMGWWAEIFDFLLDLGDEARALAAELR